VDIVMLLKSVQPLTYGLELTFYLWNSPPSFQLLML